MPQQPDLDELSPVVQTALQDILTALPGKPESIATLMAVKGMKGRKASPCNCVLSNYIRSELGDLAAGCVVTTTVSTVVLVSGTGTVAYAPLPLAARYFVWDFDNGYAPGLVEHDGHVAQPVVAGVAE